jgi:hypothetical protein
MFLVQCMRNSPVILLSQSAEFLSSWAYMGRPIWEPWQCPFAAKNSQVRTHTVFISCIVLNAQCSWERFDPVYLTISVQLPQGVQNYTPADLCTTVGLGSVGL